MTSKDAARVLYPSSVPTEGGDEVPDSAFDPTIAGYAASDGPTSDDALGFKPYVEAIASFLTEPRTKPPITLSVEGDWGSGKSSFLLQLENAIKQVSSLNGARPLTIRFNAWRHDKQDQLWAAFALAFIDSLRREIGWRRALRGDVTLLWKRFDLQEFGMSGEGRKLLLYVFAALALLVIVLAAKLSRLPLLDLYLLLQWLWQGKSQATPSSGLLLRLAIDGPWAIAVATAIAGVWRSYRSFRLPISLDLKKYMADPAYEGHTAFIETFHKDLKRLIESYAGRSRVYVFVDDLDRCDVPRAAELMQAINLMIGDNNSLIFILGMDREKVAAGVALKYKDLFPFLRETASWKPGDTDSFAPIAFGYGYLEKFIQISFTLPVASSDEVLNRFIAPPLQTVRTTTPTAPANSSSPNDQADQEPVSTPPRLSPDASSVRYIRVQVAEDDSRIRDILRMTAPLFEYNPRRIKQFTNTFRVALYLASEFGLFDTESSNKWENLKRTSPEQLGKVIALLLRFPDLRFSLEKDRTLLKPLEEEAIRLRTARISTPEAKPLKFGPWLDQPGALTLLTYGIGFDDPQKQRFSQLVYSVANFQIDGIFNILPRASRPPTTTPPNFPETDKLFELLNQLATRYTQIRATEPAGNRRTTQMTKVFEEAVECVQNGSSESLLKCRFMFRQQDSEGSRLISLAIAYASSSSQDVDWLLRMLSDYRTPFEHYSTIRTILEHQNIFSSDGQARIITILEQAWDDIAKDSGRLGIARELHDRALVGKSPFRSN